MSRSRVIVVTYYIYKTLKEGSYEEDRGRRGEGPQ